MRQRADTGTNPAARRRERVLRGARRGAGFTLLEVLVAMTILTIMGAAIFTMFRQSSDMYSKTIAHTRQYIAAREALGLMANELRQARLVPLSIAGVPGLAGFWGDDPDKVFFVAPTGMRDALASKQDLAVIGYWLDDVDGDDETPDLLMRYCLTDAHPDWAALYPTDINDANNSKQLGVLVRSLTFEYWDGDKKEWSTTTWTPTNVLPQAVRITLVVADPTDPKLDPVTKKNNKDKAFTTVVRLNNAN
ncbi:MAG: prepilin-type N-terminal cleavage/methylation domain-containing protein [Verrucomicrobia bacterium]|nr:prepilin-type N-terminal cleavage/methylation domain-containing protein [Verrucomicrobiota bacterium]